MEELLKISDLSVEFKTERATVHALNGLNLTIYKGESLGLVGEAGAGKTTAALSILNLLPKPAGRFTGGNITYCGKSVFEMREKELENLRGNKISMIFQNPLTALNPVFTVGEQIAMVLRKHAGMTTSRPRPGPRSCWRWWASWETGSRIIPISFPAACGSAWALQPVWPAIRSC